MAIKKSCEAESSDGVIEGIASVSEGKAILCYLQANIKKRCFR